MIDSGFQSVQTGFRVDCLFDCCLVHSFRFLNLLVCFGPFEGLSFAKVGRIMIKASLYYGNLLF